ncbi:acyl carrier protein [Micromonosporaceae bacterium Da 78-11]
MTAATFTLADLNRILREGAGANGDIGSTADALDAELNDLGYDSLALLETGSRIEREYSVSLDESALMRVSTPRSLIELVNAHLGASAPAVTA